ncbi:MAG: hypothetical protein QOJ56_4920 [Mycobacterium sp.]|nr:hypothetical protein [Mycobacterium sp.]
MRSSPRAGVVVIAAVALGIGLAGCGSDTKTAPSVSPKETTTGSQTTTSTAGPDKTVADYIKENNIVETPVHRGDPGSPTIDLPLPPGWQQAGSAPEWAYDAILYNTPATAADPPTIIVLVSKLVGNVDGATILKYAPGEIKKLPGYNGPPEAGRGTLSGFDAIQIGGSYIKDGVRRAVGQMTAVIPGQDGVYVLQLNAEGTVDQVQTLAVASRVIAQQAKITP